MTKEPPKGQITTLYFRDPEIRRKLEELSEKAGLSFSQYLIRCGLAGAAGPASTARAAAEDEAREWKERALRAEKQVVDLGRDLKELTKQLLEFMKAANVLTAKGLPALKPLDPKVLRLLTTTLDAKGKPRPVPEEEILRKLDVPRTDVERVEYVNATLTTLLQDKLVEKTPKGYRWRAP